jgi:hypothetical protein
MLKARKYLFIALSIGLLLVLLVVTLSYVKYQEHRAARYHLLCEILKPGMPESEVLGILHQAGEFTLRRSDWKGGDVELGISFIDPKGKELYGIFDLRFFGYKYAQAYIESFEQENTIIICDFSDVIKSSTATSKSPP